MPKIRPNWIPGGATSPDDDEIEIEDNFDVEDELDDGEDTALDSDDDAKITSEKTRVQVDEPKPADWKGAIDQLRSERDGLAHQVTELQVTFDQLEHAVSELESAQINIKESIQTTNAKGQLELEQTRKAGLSTLMSWLEANIDYDPLPDFGSVPGPRVIEIADLISRISETDPEGLYVTIAEDKERINVHFPWLSDNSTVQQTTATLVLAFAAAIADSQPLSSSVSESSQARNLAGLLSELLALEQDVSESSHGAGDAVHYSNLIRYMLIAMNHAEHDKQYVRLDPDELFSGASSGISGWLDMVAPLYRPIISQDDALDSREYRQNLAQDVVYDWLIGQDAFGHDVNKNVSAAYNGLLEFLESSSEDRFDAAMFTALNRWIETLSTFVERANTTSLGVAIVVDLTYRLGTGTMTADWRTG